MRFSLIFNTICSTLLLFFVDTYAANAQRTITLSSRIILKDGSAFDADLSVRTVMFNKKVVDERSINDKSFYIMDTATRKRKKFSAALVQELRFTDLKGRERVFAGVDDRYKGAFEMNELVWNGKIKWRMYFATSEGGFVVPVSYWVRESGKVLEFTPDKAWRRQVQRAMPSRPDLFPWLDTVELSGPVLWQLLQWYEDGTGPDPKN